MKEENVSHLPPADQLSDILLVLDKQKMKIQAVKGIGKNGELDTVEPHKKNQNEFMRIDKHGDVVSNFFSNFLNQLKNPTRFDFFKVPALISMDVAAELQKNLDHPSPEGNQLADKYKIESSEIKQKSNMETTQSTKETTRKAGEATQQAPESGEYRYKPEQIDWETMNNLGLNKERLEKRNLLDPLLKGYKTNELVNISLNLGSAIVRTDARLSLQQNDNGQLVVAIHGIRKEPTLNFPFLGHEFSREDKDNLLQKGNMGRIVDLKNPRTNEIIPSIISVDRLTNELIALRADKIKIPDEIKGVKLDDNQKQTLMEGKPLMLVGMISKKGEPFDASVQFNADKRYVEFLFDRNQQLQTTVQNNSKTQSQEAPKTFRGKELDEQQYNQFKAGQTVYVDGLKDKKGQSYQGYITFNKETSKTEFSFQNPDKLKAQTKPTEAYKTQTAVNSEGKTNEATKNLKDPLSPAQQAPKDKQQKYQQEKPEVTTKSRGRKM